MSGPVENSVDSVEKLDCLTLAEQQIYARMLKRKDSGANGFAFSTHAADDILKLLKTNNELRSNLIKQSKRVADMEVELQVLRGGGVT